MSFISNTTPTPNWLYNGEMKKMSDTELRVVLIVTRATLGWEEDRETGMRKQEDWISHTELIKRSGRSSTAVSGAVDNCVKHGWIETRDKKGNILKTAKDRRRRRVFYRLGTIFTDKLSTTKSEVDENLPHLTEKSTPLLEGNLPHLLGNTKETLTKETKTKGLVAGQAPQPLNVEIEKFKILNPTYEQLFGNKTERSALERIIAKTGVEFLDKLVSMACWANGRLYAPVITRPTQLENKMGELIIFCKKESYEPYSKEDLELVKDLSTSNKK